MPRPLSAPTPPLARTPEEWAEAVLPAGGRPFHGRQIFRWVQARGVLDASRMTDLPKDLRGQLVSLAMDRAIEIADERRSGDHTRKLLVRLGDGATVETVLIPGVSGGKTDLPSPSLRTSKADAFASSKGDAFASSKGDAFASSKGDAFASSKGDAFASSKGDAFASSKGDAFASSKGDAFASSKGDAFASSKGDAFASSKG